MKKNIILISPEGSLENFELSEVKIQKIFFNRSEMSNEKSDEIFFYKFLKNNLGALSSANGILIDDNSTWQDAVIMILYLRLVSEWNILNKPILWVNVNTFEQIIENCMSTKNGFYKYFIPNENTKFLCTDTWGLGKIIDKVLLSFDFSSKIISSIQIYIKPPQGSHQVANEWGAYKLAYTAGLNYLLPIIEELQPRSQTVYFKYLKQKYGIPAADMGLLNSNPTRSSKNYLLIDDNYDKGWELVFNAIFQKIDPSIGIQSFSNVQQLINEETQIINELISLIEAQKFQGVLLDLRLTPDDDDPKKNNTDVLQFSGGRILSKLKEVFPFLPIIMVTASNKAWNMRQLIDAGADGYFIKEDPESYPTEEVSKNNYLAFKALILASNLKFKALNPFWDYIKRIEDEGTLIDERMENGTRTKVEERIKERLKMFFGLLKRNYEDSSYNQRFYYSDIKLAFITLWSCLNDIQFIYYDKSDTWTNNGTIRAKIYIEKYIIDKLGLLTPCYLQDRNGSSNNFVTPLKAEYKSTGLIYEILVDPIILNTKNGYAGSIGEQIAFLLLKFAESPTIVDTTSGVIDSNILSNRLAHLKDKRNHLYLTHGNEDSASTFFTQLEKNNTEINLIDCADLFNIVFFLLKGEYIQINTSSP